MTKTLNMKCWEYVDRTVKKQLALIVWSFIETKSKQTDNEINFLFIQYMKEIKRNQFVTNGKENEPKSFHVCDKNTQKSVGIRFLMFQPNWMQTNWKRNEFFP